MLLKPDEAVTLSRLKIKQTESPKRTHPNSPNLIVPSVIVSKYGNCWCC